MAELGSAGNVSSGDAPSKTLLMRGCDPVMKQRASQMLPPMLGNVQLVGVTDDVQFLALLRERKFDVVSFAPGACRHNAANNPIPGGNSTTQGWGLAQYRDEVRQHQGEGVPIIETTQESQMVLLLRAALGLPPA